MNKSVTIVILVFLTQVLYGQKNNYTDSIRSKLEKYVTQLPQQKIYIHTDRHSYQPGDTIWMKAYILDARSSGIDTTGTVIYVDFLQKHDGKLINHVLVKNDVTSSGFYLNTSDTLKEGSYQIRAYTNWMRNFGSQSFFIRNVYFTRIDSSLYTSAPEYNEVSEISFFPEGGKLIEGLPNRVAFRAINKYGEGVDIKSTLLSVTGETVCAVQSQHIGMGNFTFVPQPQTSYFVSIGNRKFSLPSAQTTGYTLIIHHFANSPTIRITAKNNFSKKDKPILLVHQRGNIIYLDQNESEGNSFSWVFRKSDIPEEGIVNFALFTASGTPACERMIYNHNPDLGTQTELSFDKVSYEPGQLITAILQVKDFDGTPLAGHFSISVTENSDFYYVPAKINCPGYVNLLSELCLSSQELEIIPQQTETYFNPNNSNSTAQLDLLMLTQTSHRWNWSTIANSRNTRALFAPEEGITVKGKVESFGKIPKKQIAFSALANDELGVTQFMTANTTDGGSFILDGMVSNGKTKILFQGKNKYQGLSFSINESDIPKTTGHPDPIRALKIAGINTPGFNYYKPNNVRLLKEVEVKAERIKQERDPRKRLYEGMNSTNIKINNNCRSATHVIQMIQGKVAGLDIIDGGNNNFAFYVRGIGSFTHPQAKVIFLVDGIVMDLAFLSSIPPCEVESIDVVKGGVVMFNANAIISILTKGGGGQLPHNESDSPSATNYFNGFAIPRTFYNVKPVAINPDEQNGSKTVFWHPHVQTDNEGKAVITFWNTGKKGIFHCQVEGVTNNKQAAMTTATFSVD